MLWISNVINIHLCTLHLSQKHSDLAYANPDRESVLLGQHQPGQAGSGVLEHVGPSDGGQLLPLPTVALALAACIFRSVNSSQFWHHCCFTQSWWLLSTNTPLPRAYCHKKENGLPASLWSFNNTSVTFLHMTQPHSFIVEWVWTSQHNSVVCKCLVNTSSGK